MPSTKPWSEIRGPLTPERRKRIDALRDEAEAQIEEHLKPIRDGVAWPIPPYRVVMIRDAGAVSGGDTTWTVTVPAVPCDPFEARSPGDAERIAREKICNVLRARDWGFELAVERYPV